jgi:glycosyltransferase involved in cell wall biosynthesis
MPPRRVALVHDFLLDVRGAERVFEVLCGMWPEAELFTTVYDEEGTEGRFAHRTVHCSPLQRLRPTSRTFRGLLPLYPWAVEALDLRGFDLVVSSSSAWAHGVLADDGATHVCYCHNPFRYAWRTRETALEGRPAPVRLGLSMVMRRWRHWDWVAAQRVGRYVANSEATRRRIATCFGREADVVHPPVAIERFAPGTPGGYHLTVSALMRHKRLDVAVEAFTRLGLPLVVVGDGPDARRLRAMAGPTVRFAGRVGDAEVAELLAGCRALVVPGHEEFGIAAVEAQAAGRPVIGLRGSGLAETVVEGVTGAFFDRPEPGALIAALAAFDDAAIDPAACVANAARFGPAAFEAGLRACVQAALDEPEPVPAERRLALVREPGR